jgi:hypothetical protein
MHLSESESGDHHVQVGLAPGLSVGTTAVACFVPGTGVSKGQAFGWCASCPCGLMASADGQFVENFGPRPCCDTGQVSDVP